MEFEEDVHIQPFKNFLCPLTKEVMRDPVVLQSSHTYERTVINYWFERCLEDWRDLTCPVTGQVLRNSSKGIGTYLRSKALMDLLSMAKDEESKLLLCVENLKFEIAVSFDSVELPFLFHSMKIMLQEGITRLTIQSYQELRERDMAGNLEYPGLSKLAEVLKQMEKVGDKVQYLAAAGRFEPLLTRLCEGSDGAKIEMASLVGSMTLTNSSTAQTARQSAENTV
ncbi:U-box domain-containing protein 24-like [Pyrus communis]|uniref:U-box domain-containing protein 24-like n=1 Tax=Pyrus communis TaxID=23211 RepID=UPI0035BF9DC1